MAKKKSPKANRRHQLKYAAPTGGAAPIAHPIKAAAAVSAAANAPAVVTTERDFSYVTHDLARILVLGGGLIFVLVILWYLFGHTGLGALIYNLVKV